MDLQAVQSPSYRTRGIGRYALQWSLAIEHIRPDLVGRYLLSPALPPPGELEPLLATGKIRYSDAPDAFESSSRVFHSLAPLDPAVPLTALWPFPASRLGMQLSATVYDCIPALDPEHELADPAERRRYMLRLESLRAAAQLQVLSASVRTGLAQVLNGGPPSVVVGAAASARFEPAVDRSASVRRARSGLKGLGVAGLRRRYVLYPTGSHPRKNNERLVDAWAALPDRLTSSCQLVLVGDLPDSTRHHIGHLARGLGVEGSVITTGYVSDDLLLALYQGAALVCFPSLAEGFGLPVAEAIACGVPVIASDRPPFDDLVPITRRFDAERTDAITAALAAALQGPVANAPGRDGSPALGDALPLERAGSLEHAGSLERSGSLERAGSKAPRPLTGWQEVARRSAGAFDTLLASSARVRRRPVRKRLAFVTPLPPAATGIATYSFRLLEEMVATNEVELDAFADGPTPDQHGPDGVPVYLSRSLEIVEGLRAGYDRVVYALGNSHHHLGALIALRRRPGVVMAHDVRLTNVYRHEYSDTRLPPGGFGRAIRAMYGPGIPDRVGERGFLSPSDETSYGVLMARESVAAAERFLVTSHEAEALTALDVGATLSRRVTILPFAVGAPDVEGVTFAHGGISPPRGLAPATLAAWGRGADAVTSPGPVIGHFGIVDPVKEPMLLLEAFALACGSVARSGSPAPLLAYVGPIGASIAKQLMRRAAELAVTERVVVTGTLDTPAYASWFERATIAVQLRRSSNGEASAAVGECLASGIPTVVTDIGWMRELPDEAVVKLPVGVGAGSLADVLEHLLDDDQRRKDLSISARAEAARRSFAATARQLLDLLFPVT